MIFENSRYAATGVETTLTASGEEVRSVRIPSYYGRDFSARRHTITEGERLEQLAWRYYRDPEAWWIIAVANPEILYPEDIPAGTEVRVPDAASVR
jgi:hypothetical protein